jgi:hypothetical protein
MSVHAAHWAHRPCGPTLSCGRGDTSGLSPGGVWCLLLIAGAMLRLPRPRRVWRMAPRWYVVSCCCVRVCVCVCVWGGGAGCWSLKEAKSGTGRRRCCGVVGPAGCHPRLGRCRALSKLARLMKRGRYRRLETCCVQEQKIEGKGATPVQGERSPQKFKPLEQKDK